MHSTNRDMGNTVSYRFPSGPYILVVVILVSLGVANDYPVGMRKHGGFAALAGLLGVIVGASELISRYRDEPLQAVMSNASLTYIQETTKDQIPIQGSERRSVHRPLTGRRWEWPPHVGG